MLGLAGTQPSLGFSKIPSLKDIRQKVTEQNTMFSPAFTYVHEHVYAHILHTGTSYTYTYNQLACGFYAWEAEARVSQI